MEGIVRRLENMRSKRTQVKVVSSLIHSTNTQQTMLADLTDAFTQTSNDRSGSYTLHHSLLPSRKPPVPRRRPAHDKGVGPSDVTVGVFEKSAVYFHNSHMS